MTRLVLILAALAIPTAAMALAGMPRKGVDYRTARAQLIAGGWKPYRAADADICQPGDSRCTGRPEMQACAGTGLAQCLFVWRKGASEIEIVTIGEDPNTVSRVRCRKGC